MRDLCATSLAEERPSAVFYHVLISGLISLTSQTVSELQDFSVMNVDGIMRLRSNLDAQKHVFVLSVAT